MRYRFEAVRQGYSKNHLIVAIALGVTLLAGWWWLHPNRPVAPLTNVRGQTNEMASPQSPALGASSLDDDLRTAAKNLASANDAAEKNQALAALKAALASGSTNEISAAIRRFLDSKMDAPTGLGFKIGKGGLLTEAPTLRTWLLDYLAQIDPAAAAEYARVILSTPDSPDEWALALRNLALGDTSADARALLEEKTGELLDNPDWQQNPSAGYLEAFDTAVYLGGTNFVPTLAGLINLQDNPALAHAAFLALDRLVINNPATMLAALEADPGLLQGYAATRADFFARADVRDPQQLQLLENYLLNAQTSPAEIAAFAGIFPNANYMISPNLLTPTPTPNHDALASRDAASLNVVQQWLTDPRFASLRSNLGTTAARLTGYVQQESQGH